MLIKVLPEFLSGFALEKTLAGL